MMNTSAQQGMNICHTNSNGPVHGIGYEITTVTIILGFAIAVMNIILVSWFTKQRQFTKTTFIFLCCLGSSDVVYGFAIAVRGILIYIVPQYTTEICRVLNGFITMTVILSSICILLLSVQVGQGLLLIITTVRRNFSPITLFSK